MTLHTLPTETLKGQMAMSILGQTELGQQIERKEKVNVQSFIEITAPPERVWPFLV